MAFLIFGHINSDHRLLAVEKKEGKASASAVRRMESALRATGMPKSEAMRLISELKSSAGDPVGSGEGDPTDHGPPAEAAPSEDALVSALELCHDLFA